MKNLTILITGSLLFTTISFANIINVPDSVSTIQGGLNIAQEGDTVLVAAGTYVENIFWPQTNGIKLIGSGEEDCIIDGNQSGCVIIFVGIIINTTTLVYGFTIQNGYSYYMGGGIACGDFSSPSLKNVTITNNSAYEYGGGIALGTYSDMSLENVTITGNSAITEGGGGIFCEYSSPTLTNVTISNNSVPGGAWDPGGGGILNWDGCITLVNCILWNDTPPEITSYGPTIITYSDIEGGGWAGTGNINADPLFVDPANGDYHLTENSPCIDAGDPNSPLDPDSTIADMGAYYYHQPINAAFVADPTQGFSPLIVQFTDLSFPQDTIASWEWDFNYDDIIDSYEQNPIWRYNEIGSYTVSLTVSDGENADTEIKEDYILVTSNITVGGYAYLENQTNHSGITVTFERTDPSSLTETATTDANGYYTAELETGVYDVTYSKDGYYEESIIGQPFYSNTTLPDITLLERPTLINVPDDYNTIQLAIDVAWDGDTILVASGTYTENINYNGKNIMVGSLFLTTSDTSYISSTIIDGNQNGSVVTFNSGEDTTAMLSGFTVTNGSSSYGGGIRCVNNSRPSLENVTITNNSATGTNGHGGGGIYCDYSNPTLTNVMITGNSAGWGGGIDCDNSNPSLENVTITNNSASVFGGGIWCGFSNPNLVNVTISGNSADDGGGIRCNNSHPTLMNVTITNNLASDEGGGMYCSGSNPSLVDVTIMDNLASAGGGMYCFHSSPSLENVTISGNSASYDGGGIYCYYHSSPSLVNVTISNNSASFDGGGIFCDVNSSPSLLNTIVSSNTGNYGIYVDSGNPSITYSDFYNQNGNFYGVNDSIGVNVTTNVNGDSCDAYYNIQEDPLFIDPYNSYYHLTENSPCIDAGDPNSPYDPDSTIADMGAFYFDQSVVPDYEVVLTPYNPPIEIPAGGGTFAYNVQLINNTTVPHNFYAVLFADMPNGNQYGPISPTPYLVQLPAGGTIDVDLTQNVPGNAPAGVYTFWSKIGTGYDAVMDSSGFTFTKLGTIQAEGTGDWIGYYSDYGVEMRENDLWTIDGIYREDGNPICGSMSVDENLIPDKFTLYQNYPNPFNPVTTIRYDLPEQSHVTLVIYDLLGREVKELVSGEVMSGYHKAVWDATDSFGRPVSAGIYLYRLESTEFTETKKLLLVK